MQELTALVERLADLVDDSGAWSISSEEVLSLLRVDPVLFWRSVHGVRDRIGFADAIDGWSQDTAGDLVTVLESIYGRRAEEALTRAGLFIPWSLGVGLIEELLFRARRLAAAHELRADELEAMVRHAGSVRGAVEIYLEAHVDLDALIDGCADSFRIMEELPLVGGVTTAAWLRRMFARHVPESPQPPGRSRGAPPPCRRPHGVHRPRGSCARAAVRTRGRAEGIPAARLGTEGDGILSGVIHRGEPARAVPGAHDASPSGRGSGGPGTVQGRERRLLTPDLRGCRTGLRPVAPVGRPPRPGLISSVLPCYLPAMSSFRTFRCFGLVVAILTVNLGMTAGVSAETLSAMPANKGFATVKEILDRSCSACHDWTVSYESIIGGGRVVPGSPEKSMLYQKIATDEMPQEGEKLTAEQKAFIRSWIAAGASSTELPIAVPGCRGWRGGLSGRAAARASKGFLFFPSKASFHAVTGLTSAALFLAAGVIGVVHFLNMMNEGHAYRDQIGWNKDTGNPAVRTNEIETVWGNDQALRWWHVGLIAAA